MTRTATYPTPYGVSVPLCDNPSVKGEYVFDLDAVAICAGIHDPKERARFAADMKAAGRINMDRLPEYGGGRVKRVALQRPSEPAYPQIPRGEDFAIPVGNWITAAMDESRWCDRADKLIHIIGLNLEGHDTHFQPILALGLQIMLTGTLEHLAEQEVDCLEAAAFYALSVHGEWSAPAVEWLQPMAATWLKDWIAARPTYQRFAALCVADTSLPAWLAGGAL